MIKIISTLISPTSGTITIKGFNVKESSGEVKQLIGVISHETYLYQDLTARENLLFFGRMYGMSNDRIDQRINELVELVGLQYRLDDRVGTFSRGMKQRLSIARAVLHDPELLLLDEPYTGLDQHASAVFDKLLNDLNIPDKTQIMISHDIERGTALAHRVIILYKGGIVYETAADKIEGVNKFRKIYEHYVSEV